MTERKEFITPFDHIAFQAKKLTEEKAYMSDVSIAYLEAGGGGPVHPHAHKHDHLFIVVKGKARVDFENESHFICENESFKVEGERSHSVWNASENETIMIGITLLSGGSKA